MESNSNKYAAKNTKEMDAWEGAVKSLGGRGALGDLSLNLMRCRTPVLYVIFVDGARASL